nr:unnamed protein product [Callosobruchus chinensis]
MRRYSEIPRDISGDHLSIYYKQHDCEDHTKISPKKQSTKNKEKELPYPSTCQCEISKLAKPRFKSQ